MHPTLLQPVAQLTAHSTPHSHSVRHADLLSPWPDWPVQVYIIYILFKRERSLRERKREREDIYFSNWFLFKVEECGAEGNESAGQLLKLQLVQQLSYILLLLQMRKTEMDESAAGRAPHYYYYHYYCYSF